MKSWTIYLLKLRYFHIFSKKFFVVNLLLFVFTLALMFHFLFSVKLSLKKKLLNDWEVMKILRLLAKRSRRQKVELSADEKMWRIPRRRIRKRSEDRKQTRTFVFIGAERKHLADWGWELRLKNIQRFWVMEVNQFMFLKQTEPVLLISSLCVSAAF